MQLFQRIKQESVFWLARRLPTCKEIAPWMSGSLDRKLSLRQRVKLSLHLKICIWCVRYLEQIRALRKISARYSEQAENEKGASTASLSPEARERIKRALRQQDR